MAGAVDSTHKPKKRVGNPNPRTDHLEKYKFKPGISGNPVGRQPGSKTRLAEKMIQELEQFFDKNGRSLIQRVYEEQPATLLQSLIRILPKDVCVAVNGNIGLDLPTEQRRKIAESWLLGESALIESEVIERVATPRLPAPARDEPDTVPNRQPDKPAYHHRKKPGRDLDEFE